MTQEQMCLTTREGRIPLEKLQAGMEFWAVDWNALSRPQKYVLVRVETVTDDDGSYEVYISRHCSRPADDPKWEEFDASLTVYETADDALRAAIISRKWWVDQQISHWEKLIGTCS